MPKLSAKLHVNFLLKNKMSKSAITPTVDLSKSGLQHGFLKLPYSHDESAWGSIMIPITIARNGTGPTVLLTGANHGDEYEGPVSLTKLANSIDINDINGCLIIIPFLNYPAFLAGTRTSPIDKGNLNRLFPGKADGTVTEKIADYIYRFILPLADYVLDIHSGGKTLDFVPFAAIHILEDQQQQAKCKDAMLAFGAPYSMQILEIDAVGMLDTAAEDMGKVFVSTELGGGGTTTAKSIAIADTGIKNFLIHTGILKGQVQNLDTIELDMPSSDCYTACEHDGLLEMCVDLGHPVRSGDTIAYVHDTKRTGTKPAIYTAKIDGILSARHFPGIIKSGDTLAVIAQVVQN